MSLVQSRKGRRRYVAAVAGIAAAACAACMPAEAAEADADAVAKQLANPVAALISVPLQLNWDTGLAADGLGQKWLLNVQPVIPMVISDKWNLISRTIVPLEAQSDVVPGDAHVSGLGDLAESLFFSPREPLPGGWIIGAGPEFVFPTATRSALGSGKWDVGPTLVALRQTATAWTIGGLFGHVWSIAGGGNRPEVSATSLQPFVSKGLGKGLTVSANLEASYDWEGSHWVVPMNLSASKVLNLGHQLVSLGGGVRYYFEAPAGGPSWGLRFTFTLLFPQR